MKTLYEMIKDLTDITVEQDKISDYLENEALDLRGANLMGADLSWADLPGVNLQGADLKGTEITKKQLEQLTVIEENE
ncbi:pentapeptide repeat-containing protein [Spiroplasma citri]|uniref:pentapeptide repeat-containing protein n=1 Tax=Spiroplasma citri TaxID=2133 RepID=UPI0024128B55|nr:pentapeptide repeat-containing protein [Spiroplasma citri]WFG99312.1 pentapeptide repeat-containing protein [Spiroplasma citri]